MSGSNQAIRRDGVIEIAAEMWRRSGQQHWIPITGTSMYPLMRPGDRVPVEHGSRHIRRGDVIVFFQRGGLVVHRVLRQRASGSGEPREFITKGDNAPHPDPPVPEERVLGHVIAIQRGNRTASLDTLTWRAVGWLIVAKSLIWMRAYPHLRRAKQRLIGPQPSRAVATLRRCTSVGVSLSLKAIVEMLCRWRE